MHGNDRWQLASEAEGSRAKGNTGLVPFFVEKWSNSWQAGNLSGADRELRKFLLRTRGMCADPGSAPELMGDIKKIPSPL